MNLVCLCKSASWLMNVTNSKIIWCSHKSRKYIHPKICRNIIVVLVSFSLHTKFRYKVHVNYSQKYSCFCNMLCFYRLAIFVTRKIFHVVLTKELLPIFKVPPACTLLPAVELWMLQHACWHAALDRHCTIRMAGLRFTMLPSLIMSLSSSWWREGTTPWSSSWPGTSKKTF